MSKSDEKSILFTEDILQQTADELNIPLEKVQSVYGTIVKHLRHLVSFTNAVSIFLPHLGTMYMRTGVIYNRVKDFEKHISNNVMKGNTAQRKLKSHIAKRDLIEKYLTENKTHIKKSYHMKPAKIRMKAYSGGMNFDEIEEFQNNRNA